jgi:hypothetical protein
MEDYDRELMEEKELHFPRSYLNQLTDRDERDDDED